jgi:heavy metal sensor kinase
MMARVSIRLRLTLWYSAVLLLGLALFACGTWFALEQRLIAGVDGRLAQVVQGLRTVLEIEGGSQDPRELQIELHEFAKESQYGGLIQLRDGSGALVMSYANQPLSAQHLRTLESRIHYGGQTYQALVGIPLDDVWAVMRVYRNLLLMMIPAVLAVACLGGYWISRRALAPVDEITRVAKSISVQSLSERLVVPQTGDELQRMSETWNEVLERLDAAVKRIRQFTADASHELRTPVALIRAEAELALRRERTSEEYRRSLRGIEREAERMTALTESLLALARADSNGAEMPLAQVDLNLVVAEIVRENQARAEAKDVRLSADLLSGPAVATANYAGIRRVLVILVDNALKYTPVGGSVIVSTTEREHGIVLSVRDSGEGIEPEALPHIFERFYRADKSRGEKAGAGLGLSIAQMIAQAHGSEIEVESAPGAGSCFRLPFRA